MTQQEPQLRHETTDMQPLAYDVLQFKKYRWPRPRVLDRSTPNHNKIVSLKEVTSRHFLVTSAYSNPRRDTLITQTPLSSSTNATTDGFSVRTSTFVMHRKRTCHWIAIRPSRAAFVYSRRPIVKEI